MAKSCKIVVVDDHTLFRNGLRTLLDAIDGFMVIGEASNGEEFLAMLPTVEPDVVLLDTNTLSKKIGVPHLSFASGELMEEHLGTKPGSASVMGLINDEEDYVQLIVDKEVAQEEWFGCNPGINTSHLKIKTEDLLNKFLPQIRHKAKIMEL